MRALASTGGVHGGVASVAELIRGNYVIIGF
jgi:hypothetical protein